jgi:hypothetical protein
MPLTPRGAPLKTSNNRLPARRKHRERRGEDRSEQRQNFAIDEEKLTRQINAREQALGRQEGLNMWQQNTLIGAETTEGENHTEGLRSQVIRTKR